MNFDIRKMTRRDVRKYGLPSLLRSDREVLVAIAGDELAAYGVLNLETGEMESLYTEPEYRGMGAGTKIMSVFGPRITQINVDTTNKNAIGLYQHLGFKKFTNMNSRLALMTREQIRMRRLARLFESCLND